MSAIVTEGEEDVAGPPWWFRTALLGVLLGGVVGAAVLPGPPPPCSPPGASYSAVLERFLSRLGSSVDSIQDCWAGDDLVFTGEMRDLDKFASAEPPTSYEIHLVSDQLRGSNNALIYEVQLNAHWRHDPPDGWNGYAPRLVLLRRAQDSTQWKIMATLPPEPPPPSFQRIGGPASP